MISIVDSGSTKADWVFTDGTKIINLHSAGLNPNFISADEITFNIKNSIANNVDTTAVKKIFFFGSGCSENTQKEVLKKALKEIFIHAAIHVDVDSMGAVIATCGNEAGISCIIGTGSNSVYFDGKKMQPNNYGLGYILADEGAGTYLGKKLITHYLYGLLPKGLSEDFKREYNLDRETVITNIYNKSGGNSWLASFAIFLASHKNNEWVKNTIRSGFNDFIQLFVINYPGYENLPVHFVGSIAFTYSDLLSEAAIANNIKLGKVIQKPIDGLLDYYKNQV